jgi:hypothetical protein
MPTRVLTAVTFPHLHKGKHHMDTCAIVGTGVQVGDPITVTGTQGATKTLWVGYVMAHTGGNNFSSSDLHVVRVQAAVADAAKPKGTEDVSVTVTNQDDSTDVSAPVTTTNVPTVP